MPIRNSTPAFRCSGPNTSDTVYDIVYHEEFQNTLVGLRLLQADMLLFDLNETWQLPKFAGNVILGLGEAAPQRQNELSAIQIENALANSNFGREGIRTPGLLIANGESLKLRRVATIS